MSRGKHRRWPAVWGSGWSFSPRPHSATLARRSPARPRRWPSAAVWHGTFEELLVAVASVALVACLVWPWVVTSATVVGLVPGRSGARHRAGHPPAGAGGVRRGGDGRGQRPRAGRRTGRATSPSSACRCWTGPSPVASPVARAGTRPDPRRWCGRAPATRTDHSPGRRLAVVHRSLRARPRRGVGEIDAAWRVLYAANRDAIGSDPDLIRPGLDLEPGPHRTGKDRP